MAEVITHGGAPRAYKVCRCNQCQREAVCTPSFDFYTDPKNLDGPLFCEACMQRRLVAACPAPKVKS